MNALRASLVGLEGKLDMDQLARYTAHRMAPYLEGTSWLPPAPTDNFVVLEEAARGMQGVFDILGFNRTPAIRAAFELVQWTHLLVLWDVNSLLRDYEWNREALRQLFRENGWRTSNSTLQQVTSLGVALGVAKEANHGKLRTGWVVLPWMVPVADGFLNHLIDRPSVRTFPQCLGSAQAFATVLELEYGTAAERETSEQWEAVRQEWIHQSRDIFPG